MLGMVCVLISAWLSGNSPQRNINKDWPIQHFSLRAVLKSKYIIFSPVHVCEVVLSCLQYHLIRFLYEVDNSSVNKNEFLKKIFCFGCCNSFLSQRYINPRSHGQMQFFSQWFKYYKDGLHAKHSVLGLKHIFAHIFHQYTTSHIYIRRTHIMFLSVFCIRFW